MRAESDVLQHGAGGQQPDVLEDARGRRWRAARR
jgi:hypothetical protein